MISMPVQCKKEAISFSDQIIGVSTGLFPRVLNSGVEARRFARLGSLVCLVGLPSSMDASTLDLPRLHSKWLGDPGRRDPFSLTSTAASGRAKLSRSAAE